MADAKATGYITAAEVMQMGPVQRAQLRHVHIGGWQDQWSQQKISQMFAPAPEQSMSIRNRPKLPATIATKPHKTQRTITSAGKLGPEVEDWTEKKKVTGNKKNTNNHQLTLQESWNLPEASKTKHAYRIAWGRNVKRNETHHHTNVDGATG